MKMIQASQLTLSACELVRAAVLLGTAVAVGASPALAQTSRAEGTNRASTARSSGDGACAIKELKKSSVQGFKLYAPGGRRFLINKEDSKKVAQFYLGEDGKSELTCITCEEHPGGPKSKRFKMQPRWHPSGRWIMAAVEREKYSPPPVLGWNRSFVEGMLQSGLWVDMYAMSPDGRQWHRLTDFQSGKKGIADGYTGPAFTSDGRKLVYSQIVDGNVMTYTFGRWELILADFEERDGVPRLTNTRNITPKGMHWNEPANFHPDDESLLFTGSVEKDAKGMDQYFLNIRTGELTNLNNSPTVWDEHGVLSPDGEKIVFMTAYPYRSDPKSSKIVTIKTEFMLMDKDGSNLVQLTRFKEPGHPEYSKEGGIAATPAWSADGRSINLSRLFFPDYEYWDVIFQGPCGNQSPERSNFLRRRR